MCVCVGVGATLSLQETCLVHISVHVLSPFMAVRLESLFNSHSNFMISVLCLDVAAPFNLFIYGDAALLTGSTRLSFTSLPLASSFQSSITRPLFPPHPYMHLYRGWIHEVHVLTMCSTSLLLSLSPPLLWLIFSSIWCRRLLSPPYTPKHTHRHRLLHNVFPPCTVMVLVGLCVCTQDTVWRGQQVQVRELLLWLADIKLLGCSGRCIRTRGAQSKTVTMQRMDNIHRSVYTICAWCRYHATQCYVQHSTHSYSS